MKKNRYKKQQPIHGQIATAIVQIWTWHEHLRKFNAHSRNRKRKWTKDNAKKSKINGDDSGVAFVGENNGGGPYIGAWERKRQRVCFSPWIIKICTEKRKNKPITFVEKRFHDGET